MFLGFSDQIPDAIRAVEEGVLRVCVEVNEAHCEYGRLGVGEATDEQRNKGRKARQSA